MYTRIWQCFIFVLSKLTSLDTWITSMHFVHASHAMIKDDQSKWPYIGSNPITCVLSCRANTRANVVNLSSEGAELYEMALRILWSQKEDPLNMKYCTLEGNNTLAEGVRGEIFSMQAYVVLNVASWKVFSLFKLCFRVMETNKKKIRITSNTKFSLWILWRKIAAKINVLIIWFDFWYDILDSLLCPFLSSSGILLLNLPHVLQSSIMCWTTF